MPKAMVESPVAAAVRAAGLCLGSVRRELAVKAGTASRYYKAWQASRAQLGPCGDARLRRTAEAEVVLFRRAAKALVLPAAKAYAEALRRAIAAGEGRQENLLMQLLNVDAAALALGFTDASLSTPADWRRILDGACAKAVALLRAERNARSLGFAVFCHGLAAAYGAEQLPPAQELDALLSAMAERR